MERIRHGYNQQFTERWYGGPVHPAFSSPVSGNNASAQIAGSNPDRLALTIINLDSASVTVAPATAGVVSATKGIQLGANGGNVSLTVDQDGPLVEMDWQAFCATKAAQLFVVEVLGGP